MKTGILLISVMIAFALSFSAQAQRFGDDIVLHECSGAFWTKPKISVAGNGWIYVLMNKYGHPTELDETRIFCSKDGGLTFQQVYSGMTPSEYFQGGRDLVVTGDNESNIQMWYVYSDNNKNTNATTINLIRMDANGNGLTFVYSRSFGSTETHDVAISTNARSPEFVWSPFTIAFAASSNWGNNFEDGYIDYFYSIDGGATFNYEMLYNKTNSTFGSIDLSIGQADEDYYYPMAGIVFEMDKGGEDNIGFIGATADANYFTGVLQVNKKFSATNPTKQPKIQWLCNNTIAEPYNFLIVYSNFCDAGEWDIVQITPKAGYSLDFHTLDNLESNYAVAYWDSDEEHPDLSYDKVNNNYLLVCRKREDPENVLTYRTLSYTDIAYSDWTTVGDFATIPTGYEYYFSPVVDIDLTRTQACFAFEYYNGGISPTVTKLLFDSEWSNTSVEEVVMDGELKVFPNPATNNITLRMNEEGVYLVRMYNMLGAEVTAFQFSGTELTHDITGLPAGIYLIKLNTEKGTEFTTKIIVK